MQACCDEDSFVWERKWRLVPEKWNSEQQKSRNFRLFPYLQIDMLFKYFSPSNFYMHCAL
jgi:hypothetical protein